MSRRDQIRPLPSGPTLGARIRAMGSTEPEEGTGRAIGARSCAELAAWCEELGKIADETRRPQASADEVLALADEVASNDLAEAQTELAEMTDHYTELRGRFEANERTLVDLLALELELLRTLRAMGALPPSGEGPPPPTAEVLRLLKSMNGGT
jgi:uncharacterized membrane protein YccC